MERWATFDCYGTLVDWNGGIHAELEKLFGVERADELLARYHELEPEIQASNPGMSYREVLTIALERLAAETGLMLPEGEASALARSLPDWPVFEDVRPGLTEARDRGWRLAILSNTDRDLIDASIERLGVPFELAIVAGEIGSYKPAHTHWEVFYETTGADRARPRPRRAEPLPRHRACERARNPVDLDQPARRARRSAPDRDPDGRRASSRTRSTRSYPA